jgi:hypothetical protein
VAPNTGVPGRFPRSEGGRLLANDRTAPPDVQRGRLDAGKVMVDPSTPPAAKVRAADSILNHTTKAIEIENLEARLSELERTAEASKNRR